MHAQNMSSMHQGMHVTLCTCSTALSACLVDLTIFTSVNNHSYSEVLVSSVAINLRSNNLAYGSLYYQLYRLSALLVIFTPGVSLFHLLFLKWRHNGRMWGLILERAIWLQHSAKWSSYVHVLTWLCSVYLLHGFHFYCSPPWACTDALHLECS